MWKETKVVKNVGHNNFDARYGVYVTNEGEKKTILHIGGKEILLGNVFYIQSFEDKVFVMYSTDEGHNDLMIFTKEGELFTTIKDVAFIEENTNRRYVDVLEYNNFTNYYNLVEVETGKVVFNEYIPKRKLFVFGDMIFSNRDNIIIRYDWDGSILWQHDYQTDFNVTIDLGILLEEGVCGGKLWVKSSVDWHDILLAIDVNTGELLKAFSKSKEDTNHEHCVLHVNEVFLNQENGQVMNVYDCVSIIDSGTLNIVDKYSYKEFFVKDIDNKVLYLSANNPYTKYLIFLCTIMDGDHTPSCFFVLNTETKQIEFSTRMFTPKERSRGLGITNRYAIQFFNTGYICVHDNGDRLHIFEDVKE